MSGLTVFQSKVARVFFLLPASEGFLLAGGGALLASGLTSRPTIDLDFFGDRQRVDVADAANQFESAASQQGWIVERVQVTATFTEMFDQSGVFPVKASVHWPDLPSGLDEWIQRLCTFDPDQRPTAAMSVAELRSLLDSTARVEPEAIKEPASQPRSRRLRSPEPPLSIRLWPWRL